MKNNSKYKVIYQDLKQEILAGTYLQGSFVPTEAKLMDSYGVSRTTVRKAMELLKADGLIKTAQGSGAEVIYKNTSIEKSRFRGGYDSAVVDALYLVNGEAQSSGSSVDIVYADHEVQRELGLSDGDKVYRIQRLKYSGDIPFDYVTSYVPLNEAPGLEKFSGQKFNLNRCLMKNYNKVSEHAQELISCDNASFQDAHLLQIPVGQAITIVKRTAWIGEKVLGFTISKIRSDVYNIRLSMEHAPDYLLSEEDNEIKLASIL